MQKCMISPSSELFNPLRGFRASYLSNAPDLNLAFSTIEGLGSLIERIAASMRTFLSELP
jgi:hypothetical protein